MTAANGNVATGSNVYNYYRAGDISNLNPPQGEMAGGTRVTIETTDLDATIIAAGPGLGFGVHICAASEREGLQSHDLAATSEPITAPCW